MLNDWLCGDFTNTEQDKRLYELAKQYREETESFDKTVCSGISERGVAMPINSYEHAMINRNALRVRARILDENPGIEREELSRAIGRYAE